jgi:hypothetical protein
MSPQLAALKDTALASQSLPDEEDRQYFVYKNYTMLELFAHGLTTQNELCLAPVSRNRSSLHSAHQHIRHGRGHHRNRNAAVTVSTTGESAKDHIPRTDSDKIITYTQCRHDAYSLWDIENVLVVDFDEFVVCPDAAGLTGAGTGGSGQPLTAMGQRKYLRELVTAETAKNSTAIVLFQRVPVNTTSMGQLNCMYDKIKRGESIFNCYGGFFNIAQGHSIKSFYLGYKYPLTSYHQGFNNHNELRLYDFGDGIYDNVWDRCGLMHLSTSQWIFDASWSRLAKSMSKEKLAQLRMRSSSELWAIMESVSKVTTSK